MNRTRTRSERGYDRLACFYHTTEWIAWGSELQKARVALLDRLSKEFAAGSKILVLGDGNGRLLEQLIRIPETATTTITSVDHSEAMLRRQRSRLAKFNKTTRVKCQVEFVHADARSYSPSPGRYEVLVVPFFLDCFSESELSEHFPRWLAGLRAGGVLYYGDFVPNAGSDCRSVLRTENAGYARCRLGEPSDILSRWRAAVILWTMHVFFRWTTGLSNRRLVDIEPLFRSNGLVLVDERIGGKGMIATRIYRK